MFTFRVELKDVDHDEYGPLDSSYTPIISQLARVMGKNEEIKKIEYTVVNKALGFELENVIIITRVT